MMRIFFLEDEYSLRQNVTDFLREEGYSVENSMDGNEAVELILSKPFDLLLLDVKVLGINGFEVLKTLREQYEIKTPAIFLTSMTGTDALEQGYQCGCCDYIRKPFDLVELKLRVEQALRANCFMSDEKVLELPGGYTYDTGGFSLKREGEEVRLTKTESRLVDLLVQNRGKVVTIEQFQNQVWADYVDPANVRVQINNLRKKLAEDFIVNVRGLGYKIG